jgi:hypothetical protein
MQFLTEALQTILDERKWVKFSIHYRQKQCGKKGNERRRVKSTD